MIIGLTGQSGAGKSTVASLFAEEGFRILDCDRIVHELYAEEKCTSRIAEAFGDEYITGGAVDRKKLGALVFSDAEMLARLNEIVHPLILEAVMGEINRARYDDVNAILDAPLLFEYELQHMCDATLGVICDLDVATRRLTDRDGKTLEEIEGRLAAQHESSFFRQNCEYILENNGDMQTLKVDFYALLASLMPSLGPVKAIPVRVEPTPVGRPKKKHKKQGILIAVAVLLIAMLLTLAAGGTTAARKLVYPQKYSEIVDDASVRFGVEPSLIYAIIKAESSFSETAVSSQAAVGLMQILPDTFLFDIREHIGLPSASSSRLFEAEVNILAGTYYYQHLYEYFRDVYGIKDPVTEALAAYNAGIGNVQKWLEDDTLSDWKGLFADQIPFEETKSYVARVLEYKAQYDELYGVGVLSNGRLSEALAYRYAMRYGEEFKIDSCLVMAVIRAESTFDPNDTSPSGAIGLMQVTKGTYADIKADLSLAEEFHDLYDPAFNIKCGTYYLHWVDERIDGVAEIVAAYNAGLTAVQQWLADPAYSADGKTLIVENIPIESTRKYVQNILQYYDEYTLRFAETEPDILPSGRLSEKAALRYAKKYGEEFRIDPRLVLAVIRAESSFDPNDVSPSGAVGLMQITMSTYVDIKGDIGLSEEFEALYDPEFNIKCGTYYLHWVDERIDGIAEIAASYTSGVDTVQVWLNNELYSADGKTLIVENIPIESTKIYVQNVLKYYEEYLTRYPEV